MLIALLVFFVAIAECFNRNEHATLEKQSTHELAGAEVVDVFRDYDLLRKAITGKMLRRPPAPMIAPNWDVDVAHSAPNNLHCGRRAAGGTYLYLVHIFSHNFVATAEGVCRRTEEHERETQRRNEKGRVRSDVHRRNILC